MIGRVVGLEQSRQLLLIRDTKGNIAEMKPEPGSEALRLKLSLDLPSGRAIEFSVPAPLEVLPYLNEIKVARSVEELADQLENDLRGVEDEHDKAVRRAENGRPYEQLKLDLLTEKDSK